MADHYARANDALGAARAGTWDHRDYIAAAQVYAMLALADAVRARSPMPPRVSQSQRITEIERIANIAAEREQEILAGCTCTPTAGPQDDCPVHGEGG